MPKTSLRCNKDHLNHRVYFSRIHWRKEFFSVFTFCLFLAFNQYIDSTGAKVRAISNEVMTATEIVKAKGLKNCPTLPVVKATGKKTATMVKLEAETVKPISSLPLIAACLGESPASIWRAIFSTSTIASSTTIPITKAKASKVIVSKLKSAIAMTIQVANKDNGMLNAVIKVALKFLRKGKITKIAKTIANSKLSMVA